LERSQSSTRESRMSADRRDGCGGELYCHYGDIVRLAEGAGGFGDLGGGLAADLAGAVEAEEFRCFG